MWTASGFVTALRCQPRLDMLSPTAWTLTRGLFELKATTDAGGLPSTKSSGMVFTPTAMALAALTMERHDSR